MGVLLIDRPLESRFSLSNVAFVGLNFQLKLRVMLPSIQEMLPSVQSLSAPIKPIPFSLARQRYSVWCYTQQQKTTGIHVSDETGETENIQSNHDTSSDKGKLLLIPILAHFNDKKQKTLFVIYSSSHTYTSLTSKKNIIYGGFCMS